MKKHKSKTWKRATVMAAVCVFVIFAGVGRAEIVGHWTFDDAAARFGDSSGYGNDATMTGSGGSFSSDAAEGAASIDFSGSGACLYLCNKPALKGDFTGGRASIAFWIKLRSNSPASLKSGLGNIGAWHIASKYGDNSNKANFDFFLSNGSVQITLPVGFDKTQWHHLAVTVNAGDVAGGYRVYLDGNVVGMFAMDGTYGNFISPQYPRLGSAYSLASNTWYNLDGKIDDVRFFNHALSWQEVELLYCGQWDRADINADCSVNLVDLYQLVQNWLVASVENIDGDADDSGLVDLFDLAIIANSWMQSKNP